MELSQNSRISSDDGTKGFDLSAGKTWIYPENYPIRDYQFNIVQACLYKNTLVCLPTGLGKTFIAAVVMYNFWRWYPCGKVVFLAPTKPLVAQQIFACHNTMGIPSIETIELTGAVNHKQREIAWSKKRVIFATPQVFHNDLDKNVVPSDLVKCVVIDEAHKALGKHSYCECIRILNEKNQTFRVLALSATPGNKIDNVHEVLQNLLIAHVELRDETSLDIIPYINKRKVDIILVPLNKKLAEYKERYIFIMDRHVKILLQHNILHGHTANISKGRIFHLLKEYQKKTHKSGSYGQIIKTLNILMTMYHAYELMIRDGLRAFHKFYQNHSDKFWMNDEPQLQTLLEDITTYLGPFPDICEEALSDVKILSCDNEAVDFLTISVLRISFMHTFGRFYYAISPELDAKILRIPYDGRKFALYLLLPRNRTLDGIEHLINEVTPFVLTRYVWQMQNLPIAVSIPKFKYQFSSHMEPVLREVGIRNIFDDTATLTGIAQTRRISSNLKVSDILQKTGIEVNENGTTAYVATEIDIGNKIGEEIFHADHPFLFYIEDESTGTIIYIGRMMNPLDTTGSTASGEQYLSQSPPKLNAGISNADSISQAGLNAEDRNNLFNMYFPQALSKKYKDGNLVSSPASVKTILTMLMEGANGNTKSEIISVLRLPPEGKSRRGELAQRILASLNRNENGTEIALTTRLWVHENLRVSNNYKNILRSRYQGDIESVNFMESQSTARHINEWVRRVTHNTISSALLLNDLPSDTRLILTSVIYFKGLWLKSFDKANTKLQCFYIPNGECRNTYFMKHGSIYRYAYIPSIEAHVLEIPYSDGKTSMLTLMPRSREDDPYLRILSDDLITVPVSAILANLKKQDITIHLPKFNIENNLNLVPTLRHLGIENIFQPNTNLSKMISDSSIHVTSILQNVKLEIDEEGTLAATDTEIGYELLSSWGNDVKMDRPFLFMIIDTVLNMTLFSGRFIEPLK